MEVSNELIKSSYIEGAGVHCTRRVIERTWHVDRSIRSGQSWIDGGRMSLENLEGEIGDPRYHCIVDIFPKEWYAHTEKSSQE